MSATDAIALRVEDLHAYIGVSHILQGVTFQAPANAVTVILGRNGVGKTSTLRSVLGFLRCSGTIEVFGKDVTRLEPYQVPRQGVAYVPEDRDVFAGLTVMENLKLAEKGAGPHDYDTVFGLFPELKDRASQPAGSLSGGQQQMLSLARGLLNGDRLMLIDEPTKGLAPRLVTDVAIALERAREVSTVVMVEQNLRVARRLADHVVVMSEGRVERTAPASILEDEESMRRALGVYSRGGRAHG